MRTMPPARSCAGCSPKAGQLQEALSPVYGEKDVTLRFRTADLLWRPAGILVRFVAVLHPRMVKESDPYEI